MASTSLSATLRSVCICCIHLALCNFDHCCFSSLCICLVFLPATSAVVRLPISDDGGNKRISPGLHYLLTRSTATHFWPGSLMFIFSDSSRAERGSPLGIWGSSPDHITPVLVSLHWLPVHQQIIYKTAAPCGLRGCKNGPAPFPDRMSYKATKPGFCFIS